MNLLISGKLTLQSFKELEDELVVTDKFLSKFMHQHRKKEINKEILDRISGKIINFVSEHGAESLIDAIGWTDHLDTFEKKLVRKALKLNIKEKQELVEFAELRAI